MGTIESQRNDGEASGERRALRRGMPLGKSSPPECPSPNALVLRQLVCHSNCPTGTHPSRCGRTEPTGTNPPGAGAHPMGTTSMLRSMTCGWGTHPLQAAACTLHGHASSPGGARWHASPRCYRRAHSTGHCPTQHAGVHTCHMLSFLL